MKKKWFRFSSKRIGSAALALAMAATLMPVSAASVMADENTEDEVYVEAAEDENSADEVVVTDEVIETAETASPDEAEEESEQAGYGSSNIEFAAGKYSVPASLMKSDDITSASMAASCIAGNATMTVAEDGSAEVTVPITCVTVYGQTAYASEWKVFPGSDLTAEAEAAAYAEDEEGNVSSITFTVSDKASDGVYVSMVAMNRTMTAYLALDYAKAEAVEEEKATADDPQEEEQTGYGSSNIEFAAGKYSIPVSLMKSDDITSASMAASCIAGNATMTVAEDGSAEITVPITCVTVYGHTAYASDWKVFPGSDLTAEAAAAAYTEDEAGNVSSITFTVPDRAVDGVYVSMVAMNRTMTAYLALDYAAAEQMEYGSAKTEFVAGRYSIPVSLMKSDDITKASMAASCIAGNATMTVAEDGSAEITVPITCVTVYGQTAYASDWKVFPGSDLTAEAAAAAYTEDEAGNVSSITFTVPDRAVDGVYVSMVAMNRTMTAYLALDYTAATQMGYGSANTEFAAGKYSVPVSLMKSDDITSASMAASCIAGNATMIVAEDGSAEITVPITCVTVYGHTAYASDWKVYPGDLLTEAETAAFTTDEEGHVDSITFAVKDKAADGVYVNMNTGRSAADAYLALDYTAAEDYSFKDLTDGIYAVDAAINKPNGTTSMADNAIVKPVMLTVENGTVTVTLNMKALTIGSAKGYLGSLSTYDTGYTVSDTNVPAGNVTEAQVESVQAYANGEAISDSYGTDYPDVVSFQMIPEALVSGSIPLQVTVPVMEAMSAGNGTQNVYLQLDIDSVCKTSADDERFADDPAEKAEAVLSFESSSLSKHYGDAAFRNTLTKKTNGKLTFTSSNTSVAKVSSKGTITITGVGTVRITVTSPETDQYKAASASYRMTVLPSQAVIKKIINSSGRMIKMTWYRKTAVGKTASKCKYYIQYSTSKKFTSKTTKTVKVKGTSYSAVLKNLTKGKKYYVRMRAYYTTLKKWGKYSAVKTVSITK